MKWVFYGFISFISWNMMFPYDSENEIIIYFQEKEKEEKNNKDLIICEDGFR